MPPPPPPRICCLSFGVYPCSVCIHAHSINTQNKSDVGFIYFLSVLWDFFCFAIDKTSCSHFLFRNCFSFFIVQFLVFLSFLGHVCVRFHVTVRACLRSPEYLILWKLVLILVFAGKKETAAAATTITHHQHHQLYWMPIDHCIDTHRITRLVYKQDLYISGLLNFLQPPSASPPEKIGFMKQIQLIRDSTGIL